MLSWWGLTCFGGWPSRSQLRSPPQRSLFSKTPSWARAPCFEPTWPTCERRQMPLQKEPWQCWSQQDRREGMVGAAKVPGDGRLWQWPSGEFIKDGGLFCGRCLPRDMNVIRAQLKGQSCSMKCHRTLRGSNVAFRGRLTDAPASRLTHQRSQQVCTILCCPVTVQTDQNSELKSQIWRHVNEY